MHQKHQHLKGQRKVSKRKFKKVPKTKKGVPKKYVAGAKNPMSKGEKDADNAKKKKGGKYAGIPGASRFSKEKLDKVYKRGLGAYYSSGSRPKTSANAWAMGRVKSFVTGKGGARKADADLLKGKKKTKKA